MLRRLFHHTAYASFRTSEIMTPNQSLLATLRKKTGYAFKNCKKALEINNNDIEKVLQLPKNTDISIEMLL